MPRARRKGQGGLLSNILLQFFEMKTSGDLLFDNVNILNTTELYT